MESSIKATGTEAVSNHVAFFLSTYGLSGIFGAGLATFLLYNAFVIVYRLYFHSLAGFPGPKLAAATWWPEFYYDIVKGGAYLYKIEEMHKRYGPILRINPQEIVINDPTFYNEVYVAANTRRTEIWNKYRASLGLDGSHHLTQNHELHRRRRKPREPFFSRLSIDRIEPTIIEEVNMLNKRIIGLAGSGWVIRLDHVFSAFTGDVIGRICSETPPNLIQGEDIGRDWHNLIEGLGRQVLPLMHIPYLALLAQMIPDTITSRIYPGGDVFKVLREMATTHITATKREKISTGKVQETQDTKTSIYRHILFSSGMPESECDTERLSREAVILYSAGTATTARTLTIMCFHILSNPHIQERLTGELREVMEGYPDPDTMPTWQVLERLPYLHAIVREGLRLSPGVMRRLPRVSPDAVLQYKQWTIPAGTPVGMAAYSQHMDPSVYEDPFTFKPERWLGNVDPRMNRNWVPFSRGSRNCVGMNMAYAEMYWVLAVLFRPGAPRLEMFETDESDVKQSEDFIMPLPKADSRGLRVIVR
ncbi:putative cytochrome P450 [Aspergillus venezuelensis]